MVPTADEFARLDAEIDEQSKRVVASGLALKEAYAAESKATAHVSDMLAALKHEQAALDTLKADLRVIARGNAEC